MAKKLSLEELAASFGIEKEERNEKKERKSEFNKKNIHKNSSYYVDKEKSTTTDDIYPYNFISLGSEIERKKMEKGSLSGKIECTLKNITPIATGIEENEKTEKIKNYTISSATLKGTIRRIIEVITRSCLGNTDENSEKLGSFKICNDKDNLCFACRVFGTVGGDTGDFAYSSRIYFDDAVSKKSNRISFKEQGLVMGVPDTSAKRLYYDNNKIRGRKFYWNYERVKEDDKKGRSASRIKFLNENTEFNFNVYFKNLTEEELGVLIYAIELEEGLYHKIGRAKCYGYGRCELSIDKILVENESRYISFSSAYKVLENKSKYKEIAMKKYITEDKEIKEFKKIFGKPLRNVKFFRIGKLPKILEYTK